MTHDEMIEVIAAHKAGKKIESRSKHPANQCWDSALNPIWDFELMEYRLAPEPKKPRTIYVNEYHWGLTVHRTAKGARVEVGHKSPDRTAVPYREVTDQDTPFVPEGWQLVPKKINCVFILSAKDDGDDLRISNYKWGLILGSLPKYKGEQA